MTIVGVINAVGYAQIPITIRGFGGRPDKTLIAIIDTGFEGALSLPSSVIAELDLPFNDFVDSVNFGGAVVRFKAHDAVAVLGTHEQGVICLSAENPPLVGMELLRGYNLFLELIIGGAVTLTRRPVESENGNK